VLASAAKLVMRHVWPASLLNNVWLNSVMFWWAELDGLD